MVRGVKICPKCSTKTGSAAKQCVCGHNFHAARLSNIRSSQSSRAGPVRAGSLGGSGPDGGGYERPFSRDSFGGYGGGYAGHDAHQMVEMPNMGSGQSSRRSSLLMSRHASIDRAAPHHGMHEYGPGDSAGHGAHAAMDDDMYGRRPYPRSYSLEYDFSGRASSMSHEMHAPMPVRPATSLHHPYEYGASPSPAVPPGGYFYGAPPRRSLDGSSWLPNAGGRGLYSPSVPLPFGYGHSYEYVGVPGTAAMDFDQQQQQQYTARADGYAGEETRSVSSHIAHPAHSVSSGVQGGSSLSAMSAVRLYGLLPAKEEDTEVALYSVKAGSADGSAQRCFVTVERKRSEPSRESYACTEEGCEKANAVPAHPLSIAAILDLHCAHVEYCKKAAHIVQADKCEVTLEGYRRLVQTHGPQETLYRLGYEAAVEKQVPLVQRAGESVYVVYCGVSKETPVGLVHVEVSYGDDGQTVTTTCACDQGVTANAAVPVAGTPVDAEDSGGAAKGTKGDEDWGPGHPGLVEQQQQQQQPCVHHFGFMWHLASQHTTAPQLPSSPSEIQDSIMRSGNSEGFGFLPHPSTVLEVAHMDTEGGDGGQ